MCEYEKCETSEHKGDIGGFIKKSESKPDETPPETIFVDVRRPDGGKPYFGHTSSEVADFAGSPHARTICEYKLVGRRSVKLPIEVKEL